LEDEEENEDKFSSSHQFSKHSFRHGIIPDAAAIHAARKSRQRAREQGNQEFIALSNKKDEDEEEKQKQIFSEEEHDSAEEYENMLSLRADKTNKAEKFKSIEINDESDELENDDWESQQFRKVVGSAQLNSMNNLPYSIIPSSQNLFTKSREESPKLTTGQLLEQAYSNKRFENPPSNFIKEKEKAKSTGIRSPQDILNILKTKEKNIRDQHSKNFEELEDIAKEITDMKLEVDNADINKPLAMKNFTFYRDMKNFSDDLIDCLDEKFILLVDLEERAMNLLQKNSEKLIERRRQDIRDQFEEISEKGKRTFTDIPIDNEKRNRRSTEREGRRMRRRKMREKLNMFEVHYEGMSSDEEVPDMEINELNNNYGKHE
jgi:GC-rich sequence DNA-binding factor